MPKILSLLPIRPLLLPAILALSAAATLAPGPLYAGPQQAGEGAAAPPIRHVFVVVLENKGFDETFGAASPAPYLARTLAGEGVLLEQYYGTTHYSLGNYLAMISGQAGTVETRADCETFADFTASGTTQDGQVIGRGCVYPASVLTLPNQLAEAGKSWRAYMEDMGNDPQRESVTCGHAALGARDPTQHAEAPSASVPLGDQYAARHNPFVYFHAIIDSPTCAANVVNLERLRHDLKSAKRTPNFVFISPNLCNDGHDAPCRNGEPGGLRSADAFLRKWVPIIVASPAYRRDGLLLITFDEGDAEVHASRAAATSKLSKARNAAASNPGPISARFRRPKSTAGTRSPSSTSVAIARVPCCCHRSSYPAASRKRPSITTRCSRRSRTCSGRRGTLATPASPDSSASSTAMAPTWPSDRIRHGDPARDGRVIQRLTRPFSERPRG